MWRSCQGNKGFTALVALPWLCYRGAHEEDSEAPTSPWRQKDKQSGDRCESVRVDLFRVSLRSSGALLKRCSKKEKRVREQREIETEIRVAHFGDDVGAGHASRFVHGKHTVWNASRCRPVDGTLGRSGLAISCRSAGRKPPARLALGE